MTDSLSLSGRIAAASLLAAATMVAGCAAQQTPVAPSVRLTQHDGTTKLVGEGRLSHAPQYIEVTINVQSECHATPLAASEATDAAAARIIKVARSVIDPSNAKDGVFSRGGFSRPFHRYVHSSLTVCKGTFQQQSTIVLKSSRVASFPSRFAQLQRMILAGAMRKPADTRSASPITYATLSTPVPRLYFETRERLEQKALADALDNARKKFQAAAKVACGNTRHRVARFVERSARSGRPIPYGRSTTSSATCASALAFDAIWINKLLDVYFDVDAASCRQRS